MAASFVTIPIINDARTIGATMKRMMNEKSHRMVLIERLLRTFQNMALIKCIQQPKSEAKEEHEILFVALGFCWRCVFDAQFFVIFDFSFCCCLVFPLQVTDFRDMYRYIYLVLIP